MRAKALPLRWGDIVRAAWYCTAQIVSHALLAHGHEPLGLLRGQSGADRAAKLDSALGVGQSRYARVVTALAALAAGLGVVLNDSGLDALHRAAYPAFLLKCQAIGFSARCARGTCERTFAFPTKRFQCTALITFFYKCQYRHFLSNLATLSSMRNAVIIGAP